MCSKLQCIVLCFVLFVVDVMGDHNVEAYSSIGLVAALYVESNVSMCLPHLGEEKTLNLGIVLCHISCCVVNVFVYDFRIESDT